MAQLQLDLTTLRLFVAVCESRNFAHAGVRQHLVGSAVSKRMAALEAQVGAALFVRQRHGVATTPAGDTFLEYARAMLAEAHKAEQAMAAYANGVRGHVRLLATASVMSESLADDLVEFMREPTYSGIKVDVEERYSPEVVRGVREGHASLGITWDRTDLGGYRRHRTAPICSGWWCPADTRWQIEKLWILSTPWAGNKSVCPPPARYSNCWSVQRPKAV